MSARAPLGQRLLLLSGALLFVLLLAEGVYRLVEPPPLQGGKMYTQTGIEVPLSEIAHFLRRGGELDRDLRGPRGRLQANMHIKQGYDRPRWDYFDEQGCIRIDTNSLGFRDLEFPLQKRPGEFRVLALGDSFTYGCGVQLADSWPQLLEQALQHGRSTPVEVVNAGFACGAHTPAGYTDWVRSDGLQFGPDLVIVGFCLNDMGDVPMLSYPEVKRTPVLGGFSRLLDFTVQRLRQRAVRNQPRDFTEVVRADPSIWQATQQGLLGLQQLLAEHRVPLLVAVFPMLSQLREDYPYAGLHRMVAEFCAGHGIRCVDLAAPFLGRDERDLWVHTTDQHPNHIGQRLIADGILDYLRREGMAP